MSSLTRQFSWVSGGRVAAALLQAAVLLLMAERLGPSNFGVLTAAIALTVVPQTLSDLGLTTFILRTRPDRREDGRITYAIHVNAVATSIGAALYSAGVLVFALFVDWSLLALLPLAVWLAGEKSCEVSMAVAVADRDARLNASVLLGRRAAAFVALVPLLLLGTDPIWAFTVSQAVTSLGALLVVRRLLAPRLPKLENIGLGGLLGLTRAYWLHTVATQVRSLDTAITAFVVGPYQAGLYAVASRLTNPLRILPSSLVAVLIPQIVRDQGLIARTTRALLVAMLLAMATIYLALAYVAPTAIPWALGPEYLPSVVPVQIVCVGLIFGVTASILAGVLQAQGRQRLVGISSTVTSVYCVIAIAALASIHGAIGAAVGLVSAFFIQTLMMAIGYAFGGRKSIT
ncbi:lipopolysaccharide biosynthesis protein [Demequina sp. SO4-18]|uniref:lipopolysaccharide biosynthesis protein n=1 Tax=Demequina sp. SO4-18 TaxID=3401026 RepID=UPI003B5966B9